MKFMIHLSLFWYHLNFWYRGTKSYPDDSDTGFGIISIFGIEELIDGKKVRVPSFGIISIFGIEEQALRLWRVLEVLVSSQFLV